MILKAQVLKLRKLTGEREVIQGSRHLGHNVTVYIMVFMVRSDAPGAVRTCRRTASLSPGQQGKAAQRRCPGLREEQVEGRGEAEGGVPQVTRAACARGSGMDHFNSIFLRTLCLKK